MAGIARDRFEAIKSKAPEKWPELEVDTPRGVFEVDRSLREQGKTPTTLGQSVENAFVSARPFLNEALQFAARGTGLSLIPHLDRPRGAIFAASEATSGGLPALLNPAFLPAAVKGFRRPEEYGGGDILRRAGMGDQPLVGGLSGRDILGGVADIAFDPTNLIPLQGAKTGLRAAGVVSPRRMWQSITETPIRNADLTAAVRKSGPEAFERVNAQLIDIAQTGQELTIAGFRKSTGAPVPGRGIYYGITQEMTDLATGARKGTLAVRELVFQNPFVVNSIEETSQLSPKVASAVERASASMKQVDITAVEREIATAARAAGHDAVVFRSGPLTEVVDLRSAGGAPTKLSARVLPRLPKTPQITPTTAGVVHPAPSAGRQLFGLEDIDATLTKRQTVSNAVKNRLRLGIPDSEIATPAMEMRTRVQPRIKAQAAQISARTSNVLQRAFHPDAQGRILSLPGAPTIQDVAARRPLYAQSLTQQQIRALDVTEQSLAPVRQFIDEVGLGAEIGIRPDVMDGGFYIPRGNALEAGADEPFKIRAGRGAGKAGFQREAVFESMSEGIDQGFQYSSLRDAIKGYVQAAGERSTSQHVANYLRQFGKPIPTQGLGREAGQLGPALGVSGMQFPDVIANAVNKVLEREGKTMGKEAHIGRALSSLNTLFRGLEAGGEMSMLTIQGAIGAAADPKAYGTALRLSLKAWGRGGDEVLGSYLDTFTTRVAQKQAPDAASWVARGLQIGGPETEFTIGRGLGEKLARVAGDLPLIRQSNRGFGTFGDVLRLELADTLWDEALAAGKNMLDDAVLENIAKTANRVTGWSARRAFGSWGEVLTFAPRFFASKLETVAQVASRDPQQRELARRTFLRFLGTMTLATVTANELLGNDYDYFSPTIEINGKTVKNPQFMRIRTAGRDWSLFGTWDSLLGLAISTGTGDLPGAARNVMSSPVLSAGWDLIKGETITGTPTRNVTEGAPLGGLVSPESAKYLGSRALPFAAPAAGTAFEEAVAGKTAEAAGSALQAFSGARGSPLSPSEQLGQVTPGGDFWGADPDVRDQVRRENPEFWAKYIEKAREPKQKAEAVRVETQAKQEESDRRLLAGDITIAQWKDDRKLRNAEASGGISEAYRNQPDKKPDPAKPWEMYGFKVAEAERKYGSMDDEAWADVEAWRATLSADENTAIDKNTGIGNTALDREYRADVKKIAASGYFDLRDQIASELAGVKTTWAADVKEIRAETLAEATLALDETDPDWRQKDRTMARQLADAQARKIIASIAARYHTPILQAWRADPENAEAAKLLRKWGIAGGGLTELVPAIQKQLTAP